MPAHLDILDAGSELSLSGQGGSAPASATAPAPPSSVPEGEDEFKRERQRCRAEASRLVKKLEESRLKSGVDVDSLAWLISEAKAS